MSTVTGREYYPGTRTEITVQEVDPPSPPVRESLFDRPLTGYQINGRPFECYTIGTLAKALDDRSPVTIREWERLGLIPKPTFRSSKVQGEGKARLYTREQIEGVVEIAKDEGIFPRSSKKKIRSTRFTSRVTELFRAIDARYRSKA